MFTLLRRLRARLKYRQFERDLAREIESHRAMKQDELEASGVAPADARSTSMRALGNVTYMREEARSVWVARRFDEARQDARQALTAFRRQPVFCLSVTMILGIGLGLVTTAHALVDATYFRPWQVPNGARVQYVRSAASAGSDFSQMSFPELRYLQSHARTVEYLAATMRSGSAWVYYSDDQYDQLEGLSVGASYFDLLGVRMLVGRSFLPSEDDHAIRVPVAVIGERFWAKRFERDPAIVGRSVRIGREMHTIVGVAPDSFLDPHDSNVNLWRPLTLRLAQTPEDARGYADPRHKTFPYAIVAKLAGTATSEQASAELSGLSRQFRESVALPVYGQRLRDTRPSSGGDDLLIAWLVLGALFLVQMVACANVGNLMLARSITRQREVAVRLSLGAGRGRLVRQLVTEVMVLAAAAAVVGVGLAFLIPSVAMPLLPSGAPRAEFYWPHTNTFLVALALSVVTALVAGLAPSLRATKVNLSSIAGERHGPTVTSTRLRRLLLAVQVGVAAFLLCGAGVFTRAIAYASGGEPGFPISEFLEVTVQFPSGSQASRRTALFDRLRLTLESGEWPQVAFVDGHPIEARRAGHFLRSGPEGSLGFYFGRGVSSNYFEVIGVPLLAGRMPSASSQDEIVINRTAADRLWPGEPPLGRTVLSGFDSRDRSTRVVVGIAPDLPSAQIDRIDPVVFTLPRWFITKVIVRSRDSRIVERLNEAVNRLDPGLTVTSRPLEEGLVDALLPARIGSWVGWTIGGIGLVLAMIGAFGVFAHAVEERRREIGIRLALGADSAQVVRLVVARTQGSVAIGVVCGLGLAAVGATSLRSSLYGMSPLDPFAYLQIAGLLLTAALVATWIPARRATRVNPVETLRSE